MFSFSGKGTNSKSFGVNLPVGTGSKALSEEISSVSKKFVDVNEKYRSEMSKYKKIADFNKKLSASYISNIHAMVDISKLLNDYAGFFSMLKEEINKTDGNIGSLTADEIQYIESITKAKIEAFSSSFMQQSDKVKDLYKKYGQESEAKNLSNAQEQLQEAIQAAGLTYDDVSKVVARGGASKKGAKKGKGKAKPKH